MSCQTHTRRHAPTHARTPMHLTCLTSRHSACNSAPSGTVDLRVRLSWGTVDTWRDKTSRGERYWDRKHIVILWGTLAERTTPSWPQNINLQWHKTWLLVIGKQPILLLLHYHLICMLCSVMGSRSLSLTSFLVLASKNPISVKAKRVPTLQIQPLHTRWIFTYSAAFWSLWWLSNPMTACTFT